MPNPDNEPQIPKNQSSITDDRTGMVSRDWYRFFLNLLNKANAGGGGGGSGTVTSVNVSGGTTGLTATGGPVTTSGTITLAGTLDVDNGGTGATTAIGALTSLGAYPASNPNGYTSNTGTVTSVNVTVPSLLSVSGVPITTSGTVALTYSGTALPVLNGGTNATTSIGALTSLGAAASGANTDITSIALTTGTITTSPSADTDIVNKLYADSIAEGINFHESCSYATTADLGTATYNNGTSGVGATITNAGTQAALVIDGYTFTGTDVTNATRVLIKNQTTQSQNGVYTVTNQGSGSTNWVLTRATDFNTAGTGVNKIAPGDFFLVIFGTANANTAWVQQTPLPITVGTTAIVFIQFGAASGGVSSFSAGTTGFTPNTATSGAVTLAGTLNVANGGTGVTTSTGSGNTVLSTSPVLTTPTLGVASATTINKVALTAPATGSTLTIADGKTFTASNSITVAGTDSTTMTFPPASASIGYLNVPINSQSAAYTTVLSDSGKAIFHPSTDANERTFTIDSNANVAYATGTQLTFINMSAQSLTIAITSDTLYAAGSGSTAPKILTQYGVATATKMTTTTWIITGSGLNIIPSSVTYLVVAGGGGSGTGASLQAGAGGAGGFLTGSLAVSGATNYTVTVGGGGAENANGTNSVFSSVTSTGGGKGGSNASGLTNGSTGGSGGGGSGSGFGGRTGGAGTAGQGNNGGLGILFGGSSGGGCGGGGGAGAVGAAGVGNVGGNGGVGLANPIVGSTIGQNVSGTYYLSGGGGGTNRSGSGAGVGTGGSGGGGAGQPTTGGTNGTANTGGGAGGGQAAGAGIGGSGVVILAYPSTLSDLVSIGAGLTYTKTTLSGNTVYTFTSGTGVISW